MHRAPWLDINYAIVSRQANSPKYNTQPFPIFVHDEAIRAEANLRQQKYLVSIEAARLAAWRQSAEADRIEQQAARIRERTETVLASDPIPGGPCRIHGKCWWEQVGDDRQTSDAPRAAVVPWANPWARGLMIVLVVAELYSVAIVPAMINTFKAIETRAVAANADATVSAALKAALALHDSDDGRVAAASLALPARADAPAAVIHMVPLRGSARDVFTGAAILLYATTLSARGALPASLVEVLFDLTTAEARVASIIAGGTSVADAAGRLGVTHDTIRAHLKSVYAKTGVHRQVDLARLLTRRP